MLYDSLFFEYRRYVAHLDRMCGKLHRRGVHSSACAYRTKQNNPDCTQNISHVCKVGLFIFRGTRHITRFVVGKILFLLCASKWHT